MTALIGAVLVASLLGSMHCAGMCGAFLAFAVAPESRAGSGSGSGSGDRTGRALLHAAYNLGRLATYVVLGTLAGGLGAALDLGGAEVGLQRAAAMLAGAMMIAFGVVAVLRAMGVRIQRVALPGFLQTLALRGHRAAAELPAMYRALAVGLLTTLLPCGWLYAFLITAAGTGHPGRGAMTMAVFWVGTLPVMIGLGIGLQSLTGVLRRHLPVLTSLLIVAVGLWTIVGRVQMPSMARGEAAAGASAIERVRMIGENVPGCCTDER